MSLNTKMEQNSLNPTPTICQRAEKYTTYNAINPLTLNI